MTAVNHRDCSGCSLCLLVCPVWRETRDVRLSPRGRAKAIQHGATRQQIAASLAGCTLCGACEPACPENLPLVDLVMDLRRDSALPEIARQRSSGKAHLLLAGGVLGGEPATLEKTLALLGDGCKLAADDGGDVVDALEAGTPLAPGRLEAFLAPLREARRLIVVEGILLRALRRWLPGVTSLGVGEALMPAVGGKLKTGDLYIIETKAFNADQARLVARCLGSTQRSPPAEEVRA